TPCRLLGREQPHEPRDVTGPGRVTSEVVQFVRVRNEVEQQRPADGRQADQLPAPLDDGSLPCAERQEGHVARLMGLLAAQQAAWGDTVALTAPQLDPAEIDLTGRKREVDRWQPQWIRDAYFR
ncbi:MAG: hypothetical protein RIT25_197, partial [Planctomycetota bacterium]